MNREKNTLYRKVNTKARNVHHHFGGDYKNSRSTDTSVKMKKGVNRGLDYTPLFRFLFSKVGEKWAPVHSEAISRLDKEEPIYWLVSLKEEEADKYVRVGESSYFSGLYVDTLGILKVKDPSLNASSLKPLCKCCTHTFNGKEFTQAFD